MKIVDFDKLFKSRKNKKIVYLIDLLFYAKRNIRKHYYFYDKIQHIMVIY